jgi:hypothetical protein
VLAAHIKTNPYGRKWALSKVAVKRVRERDNRRAGSQLSSVLTPELSRSIASTSPRNGQRAFHLGERKFARERYHFKLGEYQMVYVDESEWPTTRTVSGSYRCYAPFI